MRNLLKKLLIVIFILTCSSYETVSAGEFDFFGNSNSVTVNDFSLEQTAENSSVTVTAKAYVARFIDADSSIFGPYRTGAYCFDVEKPTTGDPLPTGINFYSTFDPNRMCGNLPSGKEPEDDIDDFPGGNNFEGIDNRNGLLESSTNYVHPQPEIEFIVFEFSQPINITQVIVNGRGGSDRDIWAAGSTSSPNISNGVDIRDAFPGFQIINSFDDTANGPMVHNLSFSTPIMYLVVGALLPRIPGGPIAGIAEIDENGFSEFYISKLVFGDSDSSPSFTTPPPNSEFSGTTVDFTYAANGQAVTEWWLYAGTSMGASDLHTSGSLGTATSHTVTGLPTNGSTVHVRLWYRIAGTWLFQDFAYTASTSTGTTNPTITTPSPGSILSGATETFTYAANGQAVTEWWLYAGSSVGAKDFHTSGSLGTATSHTVTGLPTNGSTVHVRLWYRIAGSWLFQDFTYTAS